MFEDAETALQLSIPTENQNDESNDCSNTNIPRVRFTIQACCFDRLPLFYDGSDRQLPKVIVILSIRNFLKSNIEPLLKTKVVHFLLTDQWVTSKVTR
jgi:hypothetical protein